MSDTTHRRGTPEVVDRVIIRFAGDSGDGMQLTGDRFTTTSALYGNDLATLPDFPAEIRAPVGTRPGVSGFQVRFSSTEIHTPGDEPDVLVAMNPAALVVNLEDLKTGGFGAEIAAVVADEAFLDLDAPVVRLTMPDIPSPHNAVLLDWAVPSVEKIRAKIQELLEF